MMTNFTDPPRGGPMNLDFQRSIISTAGTEFFFINTAYLDAYIQLLDGIRQHRGLLVLTGEAGVGKTSLLRKLVNESPAKIKFVYCYTTNLDFDNLLAVIGDQLGVMTQEGEFSNRLEALKHCLDDYFTWGIDIAFLIDDAHHLNENALNGLLGLSPFGLEGKRAVQLVLSGTPVLEEILTQMQVFHSSLADAVHVRLEPLRTEEVAAFISRQVQNADGPAVDSLFPLPVIARINNYTGGIPRLINMLCERALLLSQVKGQTTVSIAAVDEAAGELILKDKEIAASPVADFFALETTQTGNAMQVARMEQLLAWSENLPNEEPKTLMVGPLAMEQPEEYAPPVRESGTNRSNLLSSTGLQIILLALLGLLAGLLGGMGSVYWYQRTTAEVKPQLPASTPADMTTGRLAPIDKLEPPATARRAGAFPNQPGNIGQARDQFARETVGIVPDANGGRQNDLSRRAVTRDRSVSGSTARFILSDEWRFMAGTGRYCFRASFLPRSGKCRFRTSHGGGWQNLRPHHLESTRNQGISSRPGQRGGVVPESQ